MHGRFLPMLLLAAAALVLWPVTCQVTYAVDNLSRLARDVANGRFGATPDPERRLEPAGLATSFNEMSRRLKHSEERQRRLRTLPETISRHPVEAPVLLSRLDAEIVLMDRLQAGGRPH